MKDGAKQTDENRSQPPDGSNKGDTRLTLDVSTTDARMLSNVDCPLSTTEQRKKKIDSSIRNVTTDIVSSKSDGSTKATRDDQHTSTLEPGGDTDLQNSIYSPKSTVAPPSTSILSDVLPTNPGDSARMSRANISSFTTNSSMFGNFSNSFNFTEPSKTNESENVRGKYFYCFLDELETNRFQACEQLLLPEKETDAMKNKIQRRQTLLLKLIIIWAGKCRNQPELDVRYVFKFPCRL